MDYSLLLKIAGGCVSLIVSIQLAVQYWMLNEIVEIRTTVQNGLEDKLHRNRDDIDGNREEIESLRNEISDVCREVQG